MSSVQSIQYGKLVENEEFMINLAIILFVFFKYLYNISHITRISIHIYHMWSHSIKNNVSYYFDDNIKCSNCLVRV